MNKLSTNRILLYVFLIFNIILGYKYISLINESVINKDIILKNGQFERKIESLYSDLKIRDSLTYMTIGKKLKESEIVFPENRPIVSILFRFSELNCGVCLDEEFVTLKDYRKELPISFSYTFAENDRVVKQTIENYGLNSSLLRKAKTKLEIDKLNIPYYLIINSDLEITDVFIPMKGMRALSEQFLNILNIKNDLLNTK